MFLCIEINLVLWLVALSGFAADDIDAQINQIAWLTDSIPVPAAVPIIGLILSALIQHWAYYRLYKGRKDTLQPRHQRPRRLQAADREPNAPRGRSQFTWTVIGAPAL